MTEGRRNAHGVEGRYYTHAHVSAYALMLSAS